MSKYEALKRHLQSLDADAWVAEFREIEAAIGAPLPDSAFKYPAWWSNQSGDGHTQNASWQEAGWRTAHLNLAERRVTFLRERPRRRGEGSSPERNGQSAPELSSGGHYKVDCVGLSIADAKAGLAAYFGISPDSIEITIRG